MKNKYLILLVLILVSTPFFWFKPGEINIGGDSSRLYFYDPVNYLLNFPLYDIAPGQSGDMMISYFFVPFTAILVILKTLLGSAATLVNFFHGFMLASSFLFVYLIVTELLSFETKQKKLVLWSGIISGLFYVFAPTIWNWDKAISSHNQLFLNPLIAFLLLRHLKTNKIIPLLIAVFITFLFALNFSFIAAPALFAFYPFVLLFLTFYKLSYLSTPFNWKAIGMSLVLFFGVQAFQFVPQLTSFLDKSGYSFQQVFSASTSIQGLVYFSSTYKNVKLTENIGMITSTPYSSRVIESSMYFLLFIILGGLLKSNAKGIRRAWKFNFIVLFVLTMVIMFFATANITNIGVSIYKSFFFLPGFNMFKNFYGQFIYVFSFFYAIVLGCAIYLLLLHSSQNKRYFLITIILLVLLLNGLPFITGRMVNLPVLGSKDTRVPLKMDPAFENVLQYIRGLEADGKFLTLPWTDYGYQMLAGTDGGMYIGPSMIGYLTGKKDYMGYNTITPFSGVFSEYLKRNDYASLRTLFSWLNIRYIYYDSDPDIYDQFASFPYDTIKRFFPNHESIRQFISGLGADKIYESNTYSIYKTQDSWYVPHFYIPRFIVSSYLPRSQSVVPVSLYSKSEGKVAIVNNQEIPMTQDIILAPNKIDAIAMYKIGSTGYTTYTTYPFARWKFDSLMYPIIMLKEQYLLRKHRTLSDERVNKIIFYAGKRISEISRWENDLKVERGLSTIPQIMTYWRQLKLWELSRWREITSWEMALSRYVSYLEDAIRAVDAVDAEPEWSYRKKLEIAQVISDHEIAIANIIQSSSKTVDEKKYITNLVEKIFDYLPSKVSIQELDPSALDYDLKLRPDQNGTYQVYLKKGETNDFKAEDAVIRINGQNLHYAEIKKNAEWNLFGSLLLDKQQIPVSVSIPRTNIADGTKWEKADVSQISLGEKDVKFQTFRLNERDSESIMTSIKGWKPQGIYLISFDYDSHGSRFEVKFLTHKKRNLEDKDAEYTPSFSLIKGGNGWSRFNAIIEVKNIDDGVLVLIPSEVKYKKVEIEVKNFSVTEIIKHPDILLRKELNGETPIIPQIQFQRINPTKYRVKIKNAVEPYVLIFSESFNNDWKLYLSGKNKMIVHSGWQRLEQLLGTVAQKFTGFFLPDRRDSGNVVATYFNGDVREVQHSNIFLEPETFETWGVKEIADKNHFLANGYANGWYVTPQYANGLSDYELIVEMNSQRLFYLGIIISLLFIISSVILAIIYVMRKKI